MLWMSGTKWETMDPNKTSDQISDSEIDIDNHPTGDDVYSDSMFDIHNDNISGMDLLTI
jgi:hypothetical protein